MPASDIIAHELEALQLTAAALEQSITARTTAGAPTAAEQTRLAEVQARISELTQPSKK